MMKLSCNVRTLTLAIPLVVGAFPAAAVERPFALHGFGNVIFTGGNPPTGGDVTASGTATHLGHWKEAGKLTFSPGPAPNLVVAEGKEIFTASDGDDLHVENFGAVLDTTTGIATGVFLVVGGTGRFERASGSLDFVVIQDPSGPFEVTAVGKVNF